MKSRGFPGGKRSPPGDSGGVPPGNPLDIDISAARTMRQCWIVSGLFLLRFRDDSGSILDDARPSQGAARALSTVLLCENLDGRIAQARVMVDPKSGASPEFCESVNCSPPASPPGISR